MKVNVILDKEARDGLKRGIDTLANAVKATLGPKGRNVVISKGFGEIIMTNDGVSVAKEIELPDTIEDMGAQMVKEVASKTNDLAGDGTTTATVLAQAILTDGLQRVHEGANPIDLKKGISQAVETVVAELDKQKMDVGNSIEKIKHVASISANNDDAIGELISKAFEKIGDSGVITVEDSKTFETYIDVVEGMQFDRGFSSNYFVTDSEKMITEFNNPYILVTDRKIMNFKDLVPILESALKSGRPFLIISDDMSNDVLSGLAYNKVKAGLELCVVKAPGFGERKKHMLEDICILTGAKLISDETNISLESVVLDMLGSCTKVKVDKDNTIIVGGEGDKTKVKHRVEFLKRSLVQAKGEYDQKKLQERIAKLTSGVAVLYVGAASEIEMKEKKDRVDDALHATRAAIQEGIVAGGGVALLRTISSLNLLTSDNVDIQAGIDIVKKALEAPIKAILDNAGVETSEIVKKVIEGKDDFGYNAKTDEYVNMIQAGVIDPKKVTRVALQNAASVSGMLLTTEVVLVPVENEKVEDIHMQ